MQKHSLDFSQEDFTRLAQDPAVQQLLQTLSGADPKTLEAAITQAKQGDMEAAGQTLSALFRDEQLQQALGRLGR